MNNIAYFTSDGHLTEDAVFQYVDAVQLHSVDHLRNDILEHVEECYQCKKRIMELLVIVPGGNYQNLRPHPYFDEKKTETVFFLRSGMRIAATFLIAVGVVVFAYFFLSEPPPEISQKLQEPVEIEVIIPPDEALLQEETETGTETESGESRTEYELYAGNFDPSPIYESLTFQTYRSGILRVLTPVSEHEVRDSVHFRWQSAPGTTIQFRILNNRGTVIVDTIPGGNEYYLTDPLAPGIYYWRLDSPDELLHVGKLVVPVE
jgi:hypothetical protein